jgi:hypothetical protein
VNIIPFLYHFLLLIDIPNSVKMFSSMTMGGQFDRGLTVEIKTFAKIKIEAPLTTTTKKALLTGEHFLAHSWSEADTDKSVSSHFS